MEIQSGNILLAEPFMLDPNFKRSAILIAENNPEGTTGFIINKTLDIKIHELVAGFPESQAQVYFGGPVATDSLHFIHNMGDLVDATHEVCPGVFWGGDFEKLKFLMKTEVIKDNNVKFFVGYSGWSEGQLAEELLEGSWIVDKMDTNYLFKMRPFNLWQTILHKKGNTYTVIAQMPESTSLN